MSGSAFRVLRRAAARLWVPCRLWLALAVIAGMAAAPLAADPAPGETAFHIFLGPFKVAAIKIASRFEADSYTNGH
jgi:predicted lysophospholipase L1 biosynthesis ABC-type transport system permease subunit